MANLIDVARELGTDEACLAYLEKVRWPSGLACLKCGSVKVSKAVSTVKNRKTGEVSKKRYVYDCLEAECGHQFTATTGTIFHDSHLPLAKWFMAVALMTNAKKGLSAKQMERDLEVSYRTAWYLCHRLRKAMASGSASPFTGVVEVDETFVGGKFDKRRHAAKHAQTPVFGAIERGRGGKPSQVRAYPVKRASKTFLMAAVKDTVIPDAKLICTDESACYVTLAREGFNHETVKHIDKQYVRPSQVALVHTNSIENFWSLFKRGLHGSFHQVSVKHLGRYLDEFSYRFNGRASSDLFGQTVREMVSAKGMPYSQLVSE